MGYNEPAARGEVSSLVWQSFAKTWRHQCTLVVFYRSIVGNRANRVAGADDATALDTAAGKALGPMVTTTSGIDFGSATELGQIGDERIVQHAALS